MPTVVAPRHEAGAPGEADTRCDFGPVHCNARGTRRGSADRAGLSVASCSVTEGDIIRRYAVRSNKQQFGTTVLVTESTAVRINDAFVCIIRTKNTMLKVSSTLVVIRNNKYVT